MYNPRNIRYVRGGGLPQYGFGDWLGSNAGTIGTVAGGVLGGAIGSVVAPGAGTMAGASLGASIGGKLGGGIQEGHEDKESAEMMANQSAYNKNLMRAQASIQPNQNIQGTQNFQNGGDLPDKRGLFNRRNPENKYNGNALSEESAFALFSPGRFNQRMLTPGVQKSYENKSNGNIETLNDSSQNRMFYNGPNGNMGILSPRGGSIPKGRKEEWMDFVDKYNTKAGERSYLMNTPSPQLQMDSQGRTFENGGQLGQQKSNGNFTTYEGQGHEGPDGGIPVDQMGNPAIVSGEEPVGLTENKESTFDGYVFSEELKPDGKKSFSDLAKALNKKYYG